jgi:hypothetical protein
MDKEQQREDEERKRLEEEARDDLELADETSEKVRGGSATDAQKETSAVIDYK